MTEGMKCNEETGPPRWPAGTRGDMTNKQQSTVTGPVPQGLLVVAKQSDMADREGKILYDIPYMWNLKRNDTNELIYKTGTDSQTQRMSLRSPEGGDEWGKGNLGVWNGHVHMLYLKWIMNKDLLYNTWTLLSVIWQPGWEGSLGENGYMYMYG